MVSNEKSLSESVSRGKYIGEKLEKNYFAFCEEKNINPNYDVFLNFVTKSKYLAKNKKLKEQVISYIVNESSFSKNYFGNESAEFVKRGGLEAKAGCDIHKGGSSENISRLNSDCASVLGEEVYVLSDKTNSSVRNISSSDDVSSSKVGWFDKYGFVSKAIGVVGGFAAAAMLFAYCGVKSPGVKYDSVAKKIPIVKQSSKINYNVFRGVVSGSNSVEKIGDSTYKIITPKVSAKDRSSLEKRVSKVKTIIPKVSAKNRSFLKNNNYKTKAVKTIIPKVSAKNRSFLEKNVSRVKTIFPIVSAKIRSSFKKNVSKVKTIIPKVSVKNRSFLEKSVEEEFVPSFFHRPKIAIKKTNLDNLEASVGYLSDKNGANFAKYNVSMIENGDSAYIIADFKDAVDGRLSNNIRAYIHDAVKLSFEDFKKLKNKYGLKSISLKQKIVGLNGFVKGKKSYDLAYITELKNNSNKKMQKNVSKLSINSKFILDKWSKMINSKNRWKDILKDVNLYRGFGYEVNLLNNFDYG